MIKFSKKKKYLLCILISIFICLNLCFATLAINANKVETSDIATMQIDYNDVSNDVIRSIEEDLNKNGTTLIDQVDKHINYYTDLLEKCDSDKEKELSDRIDILKNSKQYFKSYVAKDGNISTYADDESTNCGVSPYCTCTEENFANNKPCDNCKEHSIITTEVIAISELFELRGWLLASDLMMHNLTNKELDSDYWPDRGGSIAHSEQIKEIANNNMLTDSYRLDSPGNMNGLVANTLEGDVYNALGSFYYSKKYVQEDIDNPGKQIVSIDIFDRYDWGEKSYGSGLSESLLAILYKAEQIGVVTPFYTRITLTVSGCAAFDWQYTDDGVEILDVNNYIERAEIPANLYDFRVKRADGQPQAEIFVTQIAYNAFANKKNIKEVIFLDYQYKINDEEVVIEPTRISKIGSSAFSGCTNLESIANVQKVTYIGDNAFNGCTSLKSLENLDSLLYIGNSAFENCVELTSISLPCLNHLGSRAFAGCGNLKEVIWGNNTTLEVISEGAFSNTAFAEFTIPTSIVNIEEDAFLDTAITSFVGNSNYVWQNNVLVKFNVSDTNKKIAIYANPLVSEITIPNNVTILSAKLFKDNANIRTINLNEVEYIGPEVFSNSSLTNINNASNIIDCDITALQDTPWYSNNANEFVVLGKVLLKYFGADTIVKIPENIHRIGKECFVNNTMTQVVLSNKIDSIGVAAFKGATALESVIFTSDFPAVLDGDCFDKNVVLYTKETKVEEYKNNICFINLPNEIKAKEITISFYDENNNFIGSRTEYYGSKFDNYVNAPIITGKDFCGWDNAGVIININDMIDYYNDIDLTAVYETTKYQINIAGENGNQQLVLEYGQEIDLPIPEIEGKIFKGWFDSSVGGNLIIDATKTCVWDNLINGGTLYPQYDLIKYNITYNWGQPDGMSAMPTEFTVDNPVFISELSIPKKFGYLFVRWSYNGDNFENTKGIFKDIELIAEWKGKKIAVNNKLSITDEIAIVDCANASYGSLYEIEIMPSVKMVAFVSNWYKSIIAKIKVANRNGAILFGLKNIGINAPEGSESHAIECESSALYLTYFEKVEIKGGKGINGSNSGESGANGGYGINAKEVTLMAFHPQSRISIYGGDGGNGVKGKDGENGADGPNPPSGSIFNPIKGDNGSPGEDGQNGGNGGNGGYAIYAKSKIINVTRDSKYYIQGGDGGDGANGGNGGKGGNGADDVSGDWFTGTGDPGDGGNGGNGGDNGYAGTGAQGTNCEALESVGGYNGDHGQIGYAGAGGKGGDHGVIGNDGDDGKAGEKGRDGNGSYGTVGDHYKQPVASQSEQENAVVDLPNAFSNEFFEMFLQ